MLSVIAFISIVFTGRYPRNIFEFNVGVMRWTWRVTFYAYGALGTDRYPPFTLAEVPGYPAHLEVVYPEHLSRGLVLVKWWLLALPHYFVVALLVGGGLFAAGATSRDPQPLLLGGGLVGVLVLVAAVALLVTGRYPTSVFDLVIGLQRWVIRVAGYAALMTDVYPPFRLDQGGLEESSLPLDPEPSTPGDISTTSARTVVPLVLGGLSLVVALALAASSVALAVVDETLPDKDGFLMTPNMTYRSDAYAITSEAVDVGSSPVHALAPNNVLGDAKLVVSSNDDGPALFVGVAPTAAVDRYLENVLRSTPITVEMTDGHGIARYRESGGGAPVTAPGRQDFWTDSSEGRGDRTISFPVESGSWTVVVMRIDGSRGVSADVRAGATLPAAGWLVAVLLASSGFFLLFGLAMIIGGSRASHLRRDSRDDQPAPGPVGAPV